MNFQTLKHSKALAAIVILVGFTVTGCGAVNQTASSGTNSLTNNQANSSTVNTASSKDGQQINGSQANSVTANPPQGPLMIGKPAPDFTLTDLDGNATTSLRQLLAKGQPVLINAWASWCPPCKMETPDLVRMSKKYSDKIQFVGVNLTSIDSARDAKTFVRHYHVPYPVLLDTKGTFRDKYTVIGEPMTFLISPQGKVLNINLGMMIPSQMKQFIQKALKP